jgi:Ca2+:H+ antiporter
MWLCAAILPSAYIIGLVFSLHTHVDMVWKSNTGHNKSATPTYYQRLMPTHIISQLIHHHPSPEQQHQEQQHQQQQEGHNQHEGELSSHGYSSGVQYNTSQIIPVPSPDVSNPVNSQIAGLRGTPQESAHISYASIAGGSSSTPIINAAGTASSPSLTQHPTTVTTAFLQPPRKDPDEDEVEDEEAAGHDSPNWSKSKSFIILCSCTLLYSIIAEILVDTVDEVMKDFPMDEKFLGLTLFALVPNITEFMNAISFAMYGNIVLSMEIGSAYALQVCLLQIPAMVAFSIWYNYGKAELAKFTFRYTVYSLLVAVTQNKLIFYILCKIVLYSLVGMSYLSFSLYFY